MYPASTSHTPAAFVHAILRGYEKYGLDPAPVLAQVQITPTMLNAPCAPISTKQFQAFMELSMRAMDDEGLACFSRPLWWGSYSLLARASVTAPNLRVALKRWCRNHNLLTRDITLRVTESAGIVTVSVHEHAPLNSQREFCLLSILRNLLGYSSWLIDSRISCMDVAFPFPRPAYHSVYASMFSGPVRFGSAQASVSLDATYLELAVRRDEAAMREMLADALPLLIDEYRRDRLLIQRLHGILLTNLHEMRNAQDMARALNMSVRSLYRQLKEEGTSLQALKDDVRKEQALQLLHRSAMPLKKIAVTLGFSNDKSFARAFRRWFGVMPSQYRRELSAAATVDGGNIG